MNKDPFDFHQWLKDAFLSVVKNTIKTVEVYGLSHSHNFYINFTTQAPKVKLPKHLLKKYPVLMTIVLQNQFDYIKTSKNGFSIVLYFDNVAEELFIPWDSIQEFTDQSIGFHLKLGGIYAEPGDKIATSHEDYQNLEKALKNAKYLKGKKDQTELTTASQNLKKISKKDSKQSKKSQNLDDNNIINFPKS
ncbi:Stringent starvation protein B [Candidatus Hepatincolaceae symbiont of Richtersius coronifer]